MAKTGSKNITLLGVPLEEGSGRGGCAMGPAALRIAGLAQSLKELDHKVEDRGNLAITLADDLADHPNALNLQVVAGFARSIEAATFEVASSGGLPVLMGGDHALSMGSVAGMARYAASTGRPLFVLWLDAHADFNTPETSPSGNMHGMPVAHFCGQAEFAAILPAGRPFVEPDHVFQVGIRSVDVREREDIIEQGIHVHDMRTIDERGVGQIMREIIAIVKAQNGLLHVSLDVDFLDPDLAPGVGTTVPGGATWREAHLIMEMLSDSGLVSSMDIVELNPFLDDRGRSARVLVELTASLFGRQIVDRPTVGG